MKEETKVDVKIKKDEKEIRHNEIIGRYLIVIADTNSHRKALDIAIKHKGSIIFRRY